MAPSPTERTFEFFPALPTELRLSIWELSIQDPTRRVVIISYTIDSHGIVKFRPRTRPSGRAALLYVCSESRTLALEAYRPAFGDFEFLPRFHKHLRGTLVSFADALPVGLFGRKGARRARHEVGAPARSSLRGPHIYLDFSRDAIYFRQEPAAESVFDGVLRGMPEEDRRAMRVIGLDMDLCPMRRFESFYHLLCGLDEWVLFARSGLGDTKPPFANVQLGTVFFSKQNHLPGSLGQKLERHIQSAFERHRVEIAAQGGKVPRIKVEDHTSIRNQVTLYRDAS